MRFRPRFGYQNFVEHVVPSGRRYANAKLAQTSRESKTISLLPFAPLTSISTIGSLDSTAGQYSTRNIGTRCSHRGDGNLGAYSSSSDYDEITSVMSDAHNGSDLDERLGAGSDAIARFRQSRGTARAVCCRGRTSAISGPLSAMQGAAICDMLSLKERWKDEDVEREKKENENELEI